MANFHCSKEINNNGFTKEIIDIDYFGSVYYTEFYNGNFICLTDSMIVCLNSNDLKRNYRFESNLNKKGVWDIWKYKDTLFSRTFDTVFYFFDNRWNQYENNEKFIIKSYYFPNDSEYQYNRKKTIFENSDFYVYSVSLGEFGGSLYFENKKSSEITSLPCRNAVSLEKNGEEYFIVSYLAHMFGHSNVFRIKNPSELYRLPDSLNNMANWWRYYPNLVDELKIDNSIDTIDYNREEILVFNAFKNGSKIFFMTFECDSLNCYTYLKKLENGNMVKVDSLAGIKPRANVTKKNNDEYIIDLFRPNGFMIIKEDTIKVIRMIKNR